MVKLGIEGDWSPRLREVDIVDCTFRTRPSVSTDALRAALEFWGLKVNRHDGVDLRDFKPLLRGKGLSAPLVVLNVHGGKPRWRKAVGIYLGSQGDSELEGKKFYDSGFLLPAGVLRLARLQGRVVLSLGEGLGDFRMAKAVIAAGASAYIGTTGSDQADSASRLFFSLRFFYEMGRNGATVKEAWERARIHDPETRRFRLYVRRSGSGSRTGRAFMIPAPPVSVEIREAYSRSGKRRGGADWKPPKPEADIVWAPMAPCSNPALFRTILEEWGIKVNLRAFRTIRELGRLLTGKGISAPLVLFLTHGSEDESGNFGIRVERRPGKPGMGKVMGPDRIGRVINMPGKVLVMEGCDLGDPATAKAFLNGRIRAYIAGGGSPWRWSLDEHPGSMFIWQLFYELGVNRTTLREAWERARIHNCETRKYRLYARGGKISEAVPKEPRIVHAPAFVEGFERNTDNDWERDWNGYNFVRGISVPPPGRRAGLAFRMNFAFGEKPWPELWIDLSRHGHKWVNARGISFEVYVPHDIRLRKPLECVFRIIGERHEYSTAKLALGRGWNLVRLPFDSREWQGKNRDETLWQRERFNLGNVQPAKALWIALSGAGRNDVGSVYFDNVRLE